MEMSHTPAFKGLEDGWEADGRVGKGHVKGSSVWTWEKRELSVNGVKRMLQGRLGDEWERWVRARVRGLKSRTVVGGKGLDQCSGPNK